MKYRKLLKELGFLTSEIRIAKDNDLQSDLISLELRLKNICNKLNKLSR